MTKIHRYLVLGGCILLFGVLAPILIIYVQGWQYPGSDRRPGKTGILAVRTEPAGADVLLNGKPVGTTPLSERFLEPGDYQVSIEKSGYRTWQKRLNIAEGLVTWANPNPNNIELLKDNPGPQKLATGVQDFALAKDGLLYLAGDKLITLSGTNLNATEVISLPFPMSRVDISPQGTTAVLRSKNGALIFSPGAKSAQKISSAIPEGAKLAFSSEQTLLWQNGDSLMASNIRTGTEKELMAGVVDFYYVEQTLYTLKRLRSGYALSYRSLVENQLGDTATTVDANIPQGNKLELLVTPQKEVMLLSDSTLFRVGDTLEGIADHVQQVQFDSEDGVLCIVLPGELDYYNPDERRVKLISRSNEPFSQIRVKRDLNFAFFAQGNTLLATELDLRDRQNTYALAELTAAKNIYFSANNKTLFVQDADTLLRLVIR